MNLRLAQAHSEFQVRLQNEDPIGNKRNRRGEGGKRKGQGGERERELRAAEVAQWAQCLLRIVGPEFRPLEPMERAKHDSVQNSSGWGLLSQDI